MCFPCRVTGGELFEDIVAREYYSEADARWVQSFMPCFPFLTFGSFLISATPVPSVTHVCLVCHCHFHSPLRGQLSKRVNTEVWAV
jgi:hypothetical protein